MQPLIQGRCPTTRIQVTTDTILVEQAIVMAAEALTEAAVVVTNLRSPSLLNARVPVAGVVSPNNSLQRSWRHKVLGRGRPSAERTRALRARVLRGRRAAAELSR
jgi:hypothetical protein